MENREAYDVIIIGGSYAGLSAAMSLGRSRRQVLVIDSGNPCNKQTPASHNFLTNDGFTPREITDVSKKQVLKYPTVNLLNGFVTDVSPDGDDFKVVVGGKEEFSGRKIIFATGVTDTIPNIDGFSECWGISILHCPYCHGYEIQDKKCAVLGNGDQGFELAKTICHWTKNLTLYTNGTSTLSPEQVHLLNKHHIIIVENDIEHVSHENGNITKLHFKDAEPEDIAALFTQLPFVQHCPIPENIGCTLTEKGFIEVNKYMETSVPGIYAAGDCLTLFRSVANAVAAGNKVGAIINKCFIEEQFK